MPKLYSNPWKDDVNFSSKIKSKARTQFYKWLLKKYCNGCKTVLDVGCGSGQFMKTAEKMGFKATGVEIDERFMAKNVIIKDFWKLKGKWDVVFNSHLMERIEDHEKFIKKMCDLSRDIVITLSAYASKSFWNTPDHVKPSSKIKVRWLCRRYGFRILLSVHIPFYKGVLVVAKKVTSKDKDEESRKIRAGFW